MESVSSFDSSRLKEIDNWREERRLQKLTDRLGERIRGLRERKIQAMEELAGCLALGEVAQGMVRKIEAQQVSELRQVREKQEASLLVQLQKREEWQERLKHELTRYVDKHGHEPTQQQLTKATHFLHLLASNLQLEQQLPTQQHTDHSHRLNALLSQKQQLLNKRAQSPRHLTAAQLTHAVSNMQHRKNEAEHLLSEVCWEESTARLQEWAKEEETGKQDLFGEVRRLQSAMAALKRENLSLRQLKEEVDNAK